MVRVSILIIVSALCLSACAADQQQEGHASLAKDLLDCIPNPSVADLWSCASKKQSTVSQPDFETKTVDRPRGV